MKNFSFLIFFFLLSCTTIKQISNQKVTSKSNCKLNEMNSKLIYFNAKLDNKEQAFLFDTGATMSVITDSVAIYKIEEKKFGNFGTVTGADNKTIDLKTFTAKFESELFESENKVFAFIPRPKTKCQPSESFKGILGLDVFFNNNNSLSINFTDNKICSVNLIENKEFLINDYVEVKSECKSKQIFIFLTIEGMEYKFKLDTGFSGTLTIPFNEKLNFVKYNSITYIGNMFRTASSITTGEENFYENVSMSFNNSKVTSKLLVSKSIKAQNVGLSFMKAYDWIIDYNNNKVYIKKNKNEIDATFNKKLFSYLVVEKDNKLIITTKQKQLTAYNIGDEIILVNNQLVSSENVCEMQDLLNKTQDWNTLNIKVKQ